MSQIFISRDLHPKSHFSASLQEVGCKVISQSMLRFRPVDFDPPELADWLFFYSPRGVEFFLQKVNPIPQNYQLAAMGPGTSERLLEFDLEPQFVGQGSPDNVAQQFKQIAEGHRVIFVQARKSRKSIQNALDGDIDATELVVYENLPRADLQVPPCDIYVFTSPLNVKSFFDRFLFPNGKVIVSIGPSTSECLRDYGFQDIHEAKGPDEESLTLMVLQLLN